MGAGRRRPGDLVWHRIVADLAPRAEVAVRSDLSLRRSGRGEHRGACLGDDLLQGRDVLVEGRPADAGEPGRGARPLSDEPLADLDVAGVLERGELFRQGGVRQAGAVAQELEVCPLGGREQRDKREPGGCVDQLVELGLDHRRLPDRLASMRPRRCRMSIGPPTTSSTAVTETAMVAAYETPDAFRMNPTTSDTPTVTATKPRIAATPPGPSRSLRGWALPTAPNTTHPVVVSTPATNTAVPIPTTRPCRVSTAAANATIRAAMAHQYQVGMTASRMTCSWRWPISVSARAASSGRTWSAMMPSSRGLSFGESTTRFPDRQVLSSAVAHPRRCCRRVRAQTRPTRRGPPATPSARAAPPPVGHGGVVEGLDRRPAGGRERRDHGHPHCLGRLTAWLPKVSKSQPANSCVSPPSPVRPPPRGPVPILSGSRSLRSAIRPLRQVRWR